MYYFVLNGTITSIIDEFRNIFSLLAIEMILALPILKKRKYFKIRFIICLAVATVLCCFPLVNIFLHTVVTTLGTFYLVVLLWYIFIIGLTGVILSVCFYLSFTEVIWIILTGYALHHLVYVCVTEFLFLGVLRRYNNFYIMLLVYIAFAVVIFYFAYRIFSPIIGIENRLYVNKQNQLRRFYPIFLLIFLFSSFVNQHKAQVSEWGLDYLSVASGFANCIFVILAQYEGARAMRNNFDKSMMENLLQKEKVQYEAFRRSVDYINIKVHDLKHELSYLERKGINAERMDEIVENISIYESFAETGNVALDIVLTDKNLYCLEQGVSFSYMVEASKLGQMLESDIYSLFGNMVDNAIEYISTVEEKENRFIRLFVREKEGKTIIRQENYIEEKPQFMDGLPITTKENVQYHGFGTRSMRMIVEKYGGQLSTTVEEHIFAVNCFIPNKE